MFQVKLSNGRRSGPVNCFDLPSANFRSTSGTEAKSLITRSFNCCQSVAAFSVLVSTSTWPQSLSYSSFCHFEMLRPDQLFDFCAHVRDGSEPVNQRFMYA